MVAGINHYQVLIFTIFVPQPIATVPPMCVHTVACTSPVTDLREVQFRRHHMMSRGGRVVEILIRPEERGAV